jgi:histidinol dehydrogenase
MLATFVEGTADFEAALARLEFRGDSDFARVEPAVREILAAVRAEGDAAVQRYNERFGRRAPQLVAREYPGAAALARLPADVRGAMELAASRVRAFHMHERDAGFRYEEAGITLGVRVLPVARAGVYAPGGKARYPSSVIMSAVPAHVAGVREIILATPLSGDASDDPIYAAAHLSGVATIVDAGGAQAIAGLAYGTESIPRVAKIVGPGNLYVACAKRLVFGVVDIDGIAGPSEIIVVADDEADPRLIAADLLSQAEHDEAAYPLLVCSSDLMAGAVRRELELQLETLPKAAIARAALANGAAFVAYSRELMASVADRLAGEHLALHVQDPEAMLAHIPQAGAAFLGSMTPEAMGDYLAGPSHVLPTGGAVRFGSPLGVYDFVTRTSLIRYSAEALARHEHAVCAFARVEGLEAHARAVEARLPRVAHASRG